jgi:hypothetical protein
MTYHAFYTNGLSVSNPNILDLSMLPNIDYIVKTEYNTGGYPKYIVVDKEGQVRLLRVGGFELHDVGYVGFNSVTKKYPVLITVCETRLNNVFQLHLDAINDVSILPLYIVPFLKLLNEHGSYKSYEQSLELVKLRSTIDSLTKQLEECRAKREG